MNQLPAPPPEIANRQRRRLLADASSGLGVARPAHLSIRGGQFALVRADGARYQLQTTYIDVVICDVLRETSRVLFPEYKPGSEDPPVCWSDNGVGPSNQAMEPQSPLCETCQWNVKGSAQTFNGSDTAACGRRKKVAFFIPDDPQLNLYEYQIGPGTLGNFKNYCNWIGSQAGEVDLADFVTRITQDPNKQFTFKFEAVGWVDSLAIQKLEYIAHNKLSDAVVGRGDTPCDAGAVARMLQMKGSTAALPPPAATAAPAAQQFQLPPANGERGPAAYPPALTPPQAPAGFQPAGAPAFGAGPSFAPQPQQQLAPAAEAPKQTRKPRTPKVAAADPVQAGAMAPAAPHPAQQFGAPTPAAGGFQPPSFVAQAANPGPGTRLQETATENPAPRFGMAQPGRPPQSLADAMNMLPPRQ